MTTKKTPAPGARLRALTDLALRRSPTPGTPEYEQWHEWPAGTVFDPPPHMRVDLALARGIAEEVSGG